MEKYYKAETVDKIIKRLDQIFYMRYFTKETLVNYFGFTKKEAEWFIEKVNELNENNP